MFRSGWPELSKKEYLEDIVDCRTGGGPKEKKNHSKKCHLLSGQTILVAILSTVLQ